jgi:hypothetical protein
MNRDRVRHRVHERSRLITVSAGHERSVTCVIEFAGILDLRLLTATRSVLQTIAVTRGDITILIFALRTRRALIIHSRILLHRDYPSQGKHLRIALVA